MDTWESRRGKMSMVDNNRSSSNFGLKLGQNNLRTEINFQSMVPLSTLTLYAKHLDYYGRDEESRKKNMSILLTACLENRDKSLNNSSDSIPHHQEKHWKEDESTLQKQRDEEEEKISVKEVTSPESTWFCWIHRLFDLTCSLLGRRWNNSWESYVTGGSKSRGDSRNSAVTAAWLKNSSSWLRKNPLLYPSELHYVGRTIIIATITTEVLVQTVQRLNLDLNQLVTDSGIQLICLTGLLGIYKEFHLF